MNNRTVTIDFDIHKMIETERSGFNETDNEVLRRLLDLAPSSVDSVLTYALDSDDEQGSFEFVGIFSWQSKGVELPEGTKLRLNYPGVHVLGEVDNGEWVVEGLTFRTPSRAACHFISENLGREMSVNGWLHWEVKRPNKDSKWVPLNSLRPTIRIHRRQRH